MPIGHARRKHCLAITLTPLLPDPMVRPESKPGSYFFLCAMLHGVLQLVLSPHLSLSRDYSATHAAWERACQGLVEGDMESRRTRLPSPCTFPLTTITPYLKIAP